MDYNFTEQLIYQILRLAVRTTVQLPGVSLARMTDLLRLAAYDELSSLPMNHIDIATHLRIVPASVRNLSQLRRPSAGEVEQPLFVRILDVLANSEGHRLEDVELRSRVLTGEFDPEEEVLTENLEPGIDEKLDRALRYLERRGLIAKTRKHLYRLTPAGTELVGRDLMRPFLAGTRRMEQLQRLSLFLSSRAAPLTRAELTSACQEGALGLTESELEGLLRWCATRAGPDTLPYLHTGNAGGVLTYSSPAELWVTRRNQADDKQTTLLNLVKELKEFMHWVAGEPGNEKVAVKTLFARLQPEALFGLLTEQRVEILKRWKAAEAQTPPGGPALWYSFSWFGRVMNSPGRGAE